jgi:hypothetical protein
MNTTLKLVTAGLLLGAGLVLAEGTAKSAPKPHYVVVGIKDSGERVFVPDDGRRKGYVYVGFPIGATTASTADRPTMLDGGAAALPSKDLPCTEGVRIDGKCVLGLGAAIGVVCVPMLCNPPGPMPKPGDPRPPELFMNLKILEGHGFVRIEQAGTP